MLIFSIANSVQVIKSRSSLIHGEKRRTDKILDQNLMHIQVLINSREMVLRDHATKRNYSNLLLIKNIPCSILSEFRSDTFKEVDPLFCCNFSRTACVAMVIKRKKVIPRTTPVRIMINAKSRNQSFKLYQKWTTEVLTMRWVQRIALGGRVDQIRSKKRAL